MKTNLENFLDKCRIRFNDRYDYSLVEYKNAYTKIKIICKLHGEFLIRPNNHLNGQGCKKCGVESKIKKQSKNLNVFIDECKKIHENKYDYSLVVYKNRKTKIKIICNRCKKIFEKRPCAHLYGEGCRSCNYIEKRPNNKICTKCKIEKPVSEFYIESKNNFLSTSYYRSECKECQRKMKVEYRKVESHRESYRKYMRKYYRNRRKIDISWKLRTDIPTIVRRSIKKGIKVGSLWDYLPYSPLDLKNHLENKFDSNMTWENHGTYWHIDHIIPQAYFKFETLADPSFLKCWSLDNLQPLKIDDNLEKSSFYNGIKYHKNYSHQFIVDCDDI